MDDFLKFPKMARLSREIIITEKIDGTNAQILINGYGDVFAGSRNRWVNPFDDNYGFAKWVEGNKSEILKLGEGRHYGEWWGQGINRGYGLSEKRLSLFNTSRWCEYGGTPLLISEGRFQDVLPECVSLVPRLFTGDFDTDIINDTLRQLELKGSVAAPGFMNPEGIIVFHTAANVGFKKTIKDDEIPKSMVKL